MNERGERWPADVKILVEDAAQMNENDKHVQRYKRDVEFLEAHYDQLLQSHPDEWIAIYDQKVIGSSPDLTHLLEQLRTAGISPAVTLTEYLSTKEEVLILISSN